MKLSWFLFFPTMLHKAQVAVVIVIILYFPKGTATGKYHAAILSNVASLERACVSAGLRSGDLAHALPYAPELHFTEFCSHVADMKNSVAVSNIFKNLHLISLIKMNFKKYHISHVSMTLSSMFCLLSNPFCDCKVFDEGCCDIFLMKLKCESQIMY